MRKTVFVGLLLLSWIGCSNISPIAFLQLFASEETDATNLKNFTNEHCGYSIYLPNDWVEIPRDVIAEFFAVSKSKVENQLPSDYKEYLDVQVPYYGYQLSSNDWFHCPYVLVLARNSGRISKTLHSEVNEELMKRFENIVTSISKPLQISNVRRLETNYDADRNVFTVKYSFFREDLKASQLWTCSAIYTNKGILFFNFYGEESRKDFLRAFERTIKTIELRDDVKYRTSLSDYVPPSVKRNWGSIAVSTFALALLAMVFSWVRNRWFKPKERAIPRKVHYEEAKREIANFFSEHEGEEFTYDDIQDALCLDMNTIRSVCKELIREEKIT